jgi:PAS domain S-box-containing protein
MTATHPKLDPASSLPAALTATRAESLLAQAPAAIALLEGPEHRFVYANARYVEALGGRALLGKALLEALPELAGQPLLDILDSVLTKGTTYVVHELPIAVAPGACHQMLGDCLFTCTYQPHRNERGAIVGVAMFAVEVTSDVKMRQEAEARAAEFSAIVESIPDPVYVGDASGVRYCNGAALRSLGFQGVSDLSRPIGELLSVLDARSVATGAPISTAESGFLRALEGESSTVELAVRNVNTGGERIVRANYAPVRQGEHVVGAISVHTDITERMQLSRALAASESFKQRVIESSPDCIKVLDEQGRVVWINENGQRLLELPSVGSVLSTPWLASWQGEHRVLAERALQEAQGGRRAHFVGASRTFAGTPRWWDVTVAPLLDSAGGAAQALTVERDITLRKELEDRRDRLLHLEQQARQEAERANRVKDDFIATVSHELRTPLSAILGWARLLGAGSLTPEKNVQAIQIIERNAKAQAQLIEDLLDVSRIVSGKLRLDVVPTEPLAVVEAAIDVVRAAADAKGVRLEALLDPRAGPLMGDPDRLQQVVWNLLSNAVKFTPKGGRVLVRLQRRGSSVELVVEDTGRGIAPDFLPLVFEKFRQAEIGPSKTQRGLGLGLSIVKYLVEAHGGTIRASSEGIDRGARFVASFPVSPLLAHDGAREHAEQAVHGSSVPIERAPALPGVHVLVVDDEDDARSLLTTVLEQCGASVSTASDAASGFATLQGRRPDVLVSDIGMPGASGYDLIRQVRALPLELGGQTPAVALTAYARTEDRMNALAAGFNMHVLKPIEPAELVVVIASLIARMQR